MATRLGNNTKLTVGNSHRERLHALFTEVLGCDAAEPAPGVVIYTYADGARSGVYYVDDAAALTEAQAFLGAWLEWAVEDLDATRAAFAEFGLESVPYMDTTDVYYRLPGGQMVRIAARGEDNN